MTQRRIAFGLGGCLLLAFAVVTYLRTDNWSSVERFVFSSAAQHPSSPRANFMAAQLLIASIGHGDSEGDVKRAKAAAQHLDQCLDTDPDYINCLFGQVVLDLHIDRYPEQNTLSQLTERLRTGHVDATKVAVSQFSFLVRWQRADGLKLKPVDLESLFDNALSNPGWNYTGRAGIEAAYREYHEFVSGDLDRALEHADRAIADWPQQWSYHLQRVDVLVKLARYDDAIAGLDEAAGLTVNEAQHERMAETRAQINALRGM